MTAESPATSSEVIKVEYPTTFFHAHAPTHLHYVCALNGTAGPEPDGAFCYCEIGCGMGRTLNVLAAANPQAEFLGIDLSEPHIVAARALAEAGRLPNSRFLEADISKLDRADLPDFDFVIVHGLYSWVASPVRQAIFDLVEHKLRPGGLFYLSYNALPDWADVDQLRRFVVERARQLQGDLTDRVAQVLDELQNLRDKGAAFFSAHPVAGIVLERLRETDMNYVVHEFLTPQWQALEFTEVLEQLERRGLVYVGDAEVIHSFPDRAVTAAFANFVTGMPDRRSHEVAKDFVINRLFRSDLYIKPGIGTANASVDELLDATIFGTQKLIGEPKAVQVPGQAIELRGSCTERLTGLLSSAPLPLGEILDHPSLADCSRDGLTKALLLLTIDRQVIPFARRGASPTVSPLRRVRCLSILNRVLLEERDNPMSNVVLASPVAGTGIALTPLEACLLYSLDSADPVATAERELGRRDLCLNTDGEGSMDKGSTKPDLEQSLAEFTASVVPKLHALGIVEASSK